ncbi:MAG TPA: lytic murein transglycosylase B [Castellaniella sp.]|uniref:lytic murein transglycosylase B n=1 Tax=Castellaniella sp. TaxID=1955812 RepID=UPI002EEF356E
MFRPTRILQVAVTSLFLSGCAATSGTGHSPTALPAGTASSASGPSYANGPQGTTIGNFVLADGQLQPELQQFARETAQSQNIPLTEVTALLRTARYNAQAVRLMTPRTPSGRLRRAWTSYRKRHVDPIRIRRGVTFWQANKASLDAASARTGVPQSIIVAILGIETVYGSYMGDHRVLDTLTTLGFRFPDPKRPERQQMFRNQLRDLIVLNHEGKVNAYTLEGSFAGAVGLPQFMPGSIMRYAVDGNGNPAGHIDLENSPADAIASVAAFLQAHGWVRQVPVFAPIRLPADAGNLAQDGLQPLSNWPKLQAAGAQALPGSGSAWESQPLGVIDLQDEIQNTNDYRCATPNFFAITHYNRSYFYAASVADLAHEIALRVGYGDPNQV